ncbi:peroxisomal multifunctional enzyme type 2 [Ixodes scapularis]|uniref:peroxisomal multifunctional enzyme type 2 n=1 Tax=Ixodes scapularis TaxID=6945 RepID=UPI001A9F5D3F|nr:peroxisomal multifunctional enzyme type 2 [Ixodes scapularis]
MALRFDGKVVLVTGAGGGLGRDYALLFAERGASVVVNDLGGSRSGEGQSSSAADKVVEEIKAKGGKAVADYNSVEEGDKVVKTAIDNFGRIDILVNNAGILRDKAFVNMTPEEWDLIHRVHLRGSFLVTRAAWPYFRKQGYGKVIMTASGAGIFGNFGQANYGSAKLGLLGLSNTLAIEGKKYNISVNTIVPLAGSRLTEDVFPPEVFQQLQPSFVSPVVVWLCHESCPESGGVFEAAGGFVGRYQWHRSKGKAFLKGDTMTPEKVRDSWDQITDMKGARAMASVHDQTKSLIEVLSGQTPPDEEASARSEAGAHDPSLFTYSADTAILYALSVGVSTEEKDHLRFLFEGSEGFSVLPSFGVLPAMAAVFGSPALHQETQRLNVDPTRMLHGEQYLELFRPIPPSGVLKTDVRVVDVLDKGSGALLIADADTFDEHGERLLYTQWSVFFVGSGNFGGKRSTDKARPLPAMPSRKPDAVAVEKTSVDQAALYRLCGDKNPLHIDPSFSAAGGFPKPILHGLCSFGYATRHVLRQYAGNDVRRFKSIQARFTGPVVPGQSIRTEMWKEGNRVLFQCSVPESKKQIISGGCVELHEAVPASPAASPEPMPAVDDVELKTDLVFAGMAARVEDMPHLASKVKAVYEYNILVKGKPAAVWTLDLKNEQGAVYKGSPKTGKANCIITIEDDDMFNMAVGQLDPQRAFMTGRLKVKGNLMLMQKLRELLKPPSDPAPPKQPAQPAAPAQQQQPLKSDVIFSSMEKKIAKNPDLASSVKTVFQWDIKKDGQLVKQHTLDLKNGHGAVYSGTPKQGKADCTFVMEDDILHDIYTGKLDAQRAFMTGKMKITGNVLASQKLQDLWEQDKEEEDPGQELADLVGASSQGDDDRPPLPSEPPNTIKSDFIFGIFTEYQKHEPQIANLVKTIYHWIILKDGKKATEWTVDLKTGSGDLYKGPPKGIKADVTITIDDEDVIQLMLGKLNPQKAFMQGRLKIRGNIMLTQRFNQLWQEILKSGRVLELKLMSPLLSDGQPLSPDLWSDCAFFLLTKKLAHLPELAPRVQAVYEWRILKGGTQASLWTLDLKNGVGAVYRGGAKDGPADCTISMDDDIFAHLVAGRITPQLAFSKFVKVEGNQALADKVHPLFLTQAKL